MRIIDFYPSKGSFSAGQDVTFLIELDATRVENITLKIYIKHFDEQIATVDQSVLLVTGQQTIQMEWTPPEKPAGYSVRLEIVPGNLTASTAFDVLNNWTDFPRYGFLS